MRRIILWMSVSLDGYFEGPDGELDWHLVDDELHTYFNDELRTMSADLSGRRTFELMEAFWPTADVDPASTAPMREFAGIYRNMPKEVWSRTMASAPPGVTLHRELDPVAVRELRARPGGNMTVGGADLAGALLGHGLVDEVRLFVHPVLPGRGHPLFPTADQPVPLRLVETRTFGDGVVMLRHGVGAE